MGFEQLKTKLAGKEEGYAVNDENIQEWINMPSDQKKSLIAEAKEKGGAWRESLLEIDSKAKEMLSELKMRSGDKPLGFRAEEAAKKAAMDKDAASLTRAAGQAAKGSGATLAKPGDLHYDPETGGKASIMKAAKRQFDELPGAVKYGAPAALAAGLGAVALAKKMRGSKKK